MFEFFEWCWTKILWLMQLAKPENLKALLDSVGLPWLSYAILAAIIFSETGLLVGFFLPGDSLLFAAGFLASQDVLNIFWLNVTLMVAAILGDAVNYHLGQWMGESVFEKGRIRFVKHDHILAAKAFYEKHGGVAIILARFVPLVRTFTPFVAGVAQMRYRQFVLYNILGGVGWVLSMTLAGYWLGQIPFVAKNFELVVLAIIGISVLPVVIGVLRGFLKNRRAVEDSPAPVEPGGENG